MHLVHFFASDEEVAPCVAQYAYEGLVAGEGVILIATAAHNHEIREALSSLQIDVSLAISIGQLVILDAERTLARILDEAGAPNPHRFQETVGTLMAEMTKAYSLVRAYGEMVDLLAGSGRLESALALEALWNELGKTRSFSLLCCYSISNFEKDADGKAIQSVCACHTHVVSTDQLTTLAH